jgi:hypothetical protein
MGYLITIGLAWFPWLLFDKKILGNDYDNGMLFFSVVVFLGCMAAWYGRLANNISIPIEDVFGKIGLGVFGLAVVNKIFEMASGQF